MTSIGVRELRQRASEFLRRVERGETIGVTNRRRLVAILSPPAAGTLLDRLRALGEIEPATGNLDDLPEPLLLGRRVAQPSAVLARLRRDER